MLHNVQKNVVAYGSNLNQMKVLSLEFVLVLVQTTEYRARLLFRVQLGQTDPNQGAPNQFRPWLVQVQALNSSLFYIHMQVQSSTEAGAALYMYVLLCQCQMLDARTRTVNYVLCSQNQNWRTEVERRTLELQLLLRSLKLEVRSISIRSIF